MAAATHSVFPFVILFSEIFTAFGQDSAVVEILEARSSSRPRLPDPNFPGVPPHALPPLQSNPGLPSHRPLGPGLPSQPVILRQPPEQLQPQRQFVLSHGILNITQEGRNVTLKGTLTGLPPGLQLGFHIHQNGDLRDGCSATGPHFNPLGDTHGGRRSTVRHAGDLGNIKVDQNGMATISITVSGVSLGRGPLSIIGRSVVVHAGRDDRGRGRTPDSSTTGSSGAAIACGVIGLIDSTPPCTDSSSDCALRVQQCNDPAHTREMTRDCRKTCGFCDCGDEDNRCPAYQQWCRVPEARHVRERCRLTCGLCGCKDTSNQCSDAKHLCNDAEYGEHISRICAKTCEKC